MMKLWTEGADGINEIGGLRSNKIYKQVIAVFYIKLSIFNLVCLLIEVKCLALLSHLCSQNETLETQRDV